MNIYIAEISTPYHRGALIALIPSTVAFGYILETFFLNMFWNITIFFMLVMSVGSLSFAYFSLPESPIWLYSKGKCQESIAVLTDLRCTEQRTINEEMKQIQRFCGTHKITLNIFRLLNEFLKAWKPFGLAIILFVLMEFTGYRVLVMYLTFLLDRLVVPNESYNIDVYWLACYSGSFMAPLVLYFINVKIILSIASFGMGICLFVLGVFRNHIWSLNTCLGLYVFFSHIGMIPIMYIVAGEIFPQKVNSIMSSLILLLSNMFLSEYSTVYAQMFHLMRPNIVLWVLSVCCFILCILVIFLLPNTRGKTLNEIQELYFTKKNKKLTK